MSDTSTLRRIAKWYQNLPHQNDALDYIESKLSAAELEQALNLYSPKRIKYERENSSDLPIEVNLPVPYLSQLDNKYRPSGTCNVTSVAMCLMYFGIKPETKEPQLEDELFLHMEQRGLDRHYHSHLAKVFQSYGVSDRFSTIATWEYVKIHLANKFPVIISGQFTRSGHIIVLRGYNELDRVFYVNDPFGEYFSWGYKTSNSGENLSYSYDLCQRVSYGKPEVTWAHFPEKQ